MEPGTKIWLAILAVIALIIILIIVKPKIKDIWFDLTCRIEARRQKKRWFEECQISQEKSKALLKRLEEARLAAEFHDIFGFHPSQIRRKRNQAEIFVKIGMIELDLCQKASTRSKSKKHRDEYSKVCAEFNAAIEAVRRYSPGLEKRVPHWSKMARLLIETDTGKIPVRQVLQLTQEVKKRVSRMTKELTAPPAPKLIVNT